MKTVVAILLAGIILSGQVHAAIPLQVNYQGRVMVGGVPFNGNGLFRFTLADRTTSVTLWCNDASRNGQSANTTPTRAVNLPIINGIFNVRLGDTVVPNMRAIPSTVFNSDRVVLRVWFDDQVNRNRLLLPDQPITSVAYAYHALMAETATTATTANVAKNANRATTATIALSANTARLADRSTTATYAPTAGTAILSNRALQADRTTTATIALTANIARNADRSTTATFAQNAGAAALTNRALQADRATTATFAQRSDRATTATVGLRATTATLALSANLARLADMATTTGFAFNTGHARNADIATTAGLALWAKGAEHAEMATTAAFALNPGWALTGNAGTMEGRDFLGTRDNVRFEIRVNNTPALHLHPTGGAPNLVVGSPVNAFMPGVMGATISGGGDVGFANVVADAFGAVGGGGGNQAGSNDGVSTSAMYAVVGGGFANAALGPYATVGGGATNVAEGSEATVAGGKGNSALGMSATVSGGNWNGATTESTVAGGGSNWAIGLAASIGGGWMNVAGGGQSTIAGGFANEAMGEKATVGGGYRNVATTNSVVAGGNLNTANGPSAAIGGGDSNEASGLAAAVPGGMGNSALGDFSFAAGFQAQALHRGTFVWGDDSPGFPSTGDNQFIIRARGGVGINTNIPGPYMLRVVGPIGFGGDLDMDAGGGLHGIYNLAEPIFPQDAATRNYVDTTLGGYVPTTATFAFTAGLARNADLATTAAFANHAATATTAAFVMNPPPAMIPNYITGCELEFVDTSTIRVAPGSIDLAKAMLTNGLYSPNIDVSQSGNWLSGAEDVSMWIYVYLGSGAPGWIANLSDQPPDSHDTMGRSGGVLRYRNYAGKWYRCVGAVRNDATSNIVKFYQSGNVIMYDNPNANSVLSNGQAVTWTDVNCSSYVPMPLSSSVGLLWSTLEGTSIYIRRNGSTTSEGMILGPDGGEVGVVERVPVDGSGIFEYYKTTSANGVNFKVKNYYLDVR